MPFEFDTITNKLVFHHENIKIEFPNINSFVHIDLENVRLISMNYSIITEGNRISCMFDNGVLIDMKNEIESLEKALKQIFYFNK